MTPPTPGDANSPPRAMSLEESMHALRELNRQLQQLNARLEYLSLILKLRAPS